MSLTQAVELASKLPRDVTEPPHEGLMWNPKSKTIINSHKVTLREVLAYMIGTNLEKYPEATLLERYRSETGVGAAELPSRLI